MARRRKYARKSARRSSRRRRQLASAPMPSSLYGLGQFDYDQGMSMTTIAFWHPRTTERP